VIALGGNALIGPDRPLDVAPQRAQLRRAVDALAPLARHHDLVVTHGNGPQVGLLALETAADASLGAPYPLDSLVAETQGMIGYWLAQSLRNAIDGREVAALVTQTLVVATDPAFATPTKFIGPGYSEHGAAEIARRRGWTVGPDGQRWRRVVASPTPVAVVEIGLVRRLLDVGVIVVCCGGGGVPVIRDGRGTVHGVEAVVDKDLTSALVAELVGADALLLLTNVPAVSTDPTDPRAPVLVRVTPADLRARSFPSGSMGPKVDAACRFVERTGAMAAIGALDDAERILAGDAGTIVTTSGAYPPP